MMTDCFVVKLEDGALMYFDNAERLNSNKSTVYIAYCNEKKYVLKISESASASYLHLQQVSFAKLYSPNSFLSKTYWGVIVGNNQANHDVIIMPIYNELLTLDKAFRDQSISSVDIAIKLAHCVFNMHKQGISGFDTEFYWSTEFCDVVVLDIGLPFTFDRTSSEMVSQQIICEEANLLGQQYILYSCCPIERLHEVVEINQGIIEMLVGNLYSTDKYIEKLAKVHAVDFWGRIGADRVGLFNIFSKEYTRLSKFRLTNHQTIYIKAMEEAVYDGVKCASCCMYEVRSPSRITSHCIANVEGSGYLLP